LTIIVNLVYLCSIKSAVMKTHYLNEIFSAFNAIRNIIFGKLDGRNLTNIKWSDVLVPFKFSKSNVERYLLIIAKAAVKETIGADIEIKLLLLLIGGYFLSARDALFHSTLIEKITKTHTATYHLPELA
jgi:hypothetical protein